MNWLQNIMRSRMHNIIAGASALFGVSEARPMIFIGRGLVGRSEAEALRSDWERIGCDLRQGMVIFAGECKLEPPCGSQFEQSQEEASCLLPPVRAVVEV